MARTTRDESAGLAQRPAWPVGGGEMGARMRAHDWAQTPLGPVEAWPQSLRTAVALLLGMRQPACLWWGPAPRLLYNDAYRTILGPKHPDALGRTMAEVWPELVDTTPHPLEVVRAQGPQLLVDREFALAADADGAPRSRWFTSTWTPLPDETGAVLGVFNASIETTERVLAERALRASEERQAVLLRLSDALRPLADPGAIQAAATRVLREQLDAGWCYYVEWDDAAQRGVVLRDAVRAGLPSLAGTHDVADAAPFLDVLRAGQVFNVRDYASYELLGPDLRARYTALGFRSMVGTPLVKEGRLVATLLVGDTRPRDWPAEAVTLLQEVADRTWDALQRARAEAALRESEARFRTLAETAPALIWQNDAAGRNLFVNRSFLDFSGRTAEQIRGAGWQDLIHPDDAAAYIADYLAAVQAQRAWHNRGRVRRHDGAWRWLDNYAQPLHDADGAYRGHVGVSIDITASVEADAKLRASEARLRRALEIETVGVIFFQTTGAITYANAAFLRLSGYTPEDLTQGRMRWDAMTPPEHLPASLHAVEEFETTGRTTPYEKEFVRKDGARWWGLFAATRIDDETGVEYVIDITARKRVEAALRASEARFRSFAESSADTLWIVDAASGQVEYLSPAFERMWGAPRDVILRDPGRWAELVHPEDRARAEQPLPLALARTVGVVDYRIVRPATGEVRWIRGTAFRICDAQGAVTRYGGIAQDITDQKAAEAALRAAHDALEARVAERTAELAAAVEELRASEGRLRLLVEQMPAALWTTDRELRLTALLGAAVPAAAQAGLGQAMPDFLYATAGNAAGAAAAVEAHRRALAGVPSGFEAETAAHTYAGYVEPLRDREGRIVGVIGVAHDVTERALLRLQDEFLALASHELRTPLTPTMGYLEMALATLDGASPTPARRYVARAVEQVGRLNELVGDLLDVGRLRGGKLDLAMDDVDLGAMVRRAVETAEVEARTQGQQITLDAPEEPLLVHGAARRLEQVVLNLLTNAIKYAAQSPTIAVRLTRDTEADQAVLEVQDAGPGIAAADVPHLFSRFYQVERSDRPSRGGLGLGLYLVQQLVEAHGGTVGVASTVGVGTTFTVRLPLREGGGSAGMPREAGEGTADG